MGIFSFSTGELNLEQVDKLNKILPESLRKSVWKKSDFQGKDSLFDKLLNLEEVANNSIEKLQKKLDKKEGEFANIEASSIKIFNTELYNAEPLGLIDIGLVKKFSATSSGDRYSAGIIGYAIENALDKVYAENKVQTGAIEQAKLELLRKQGGIIQVVICSLNMKLILENLAHREMSSFICEVRRQRVKTTLSIKP